MNARLLSAEHLAREAHVDLTLAREHIAGGNLAGAKYRGSIAVARLKYALRVASTNLPSSCSEQSIARRQDQGQ